MEWLGLEIAIIYTIHIRNDREGDHSMITSKVEHESAASFLADVFADEEIPAPVAKVYIFRASHICNQIWDQLRSPLGI